MSDLYTDPVLVPGRVVRAVYTDGGVILRNPSPHGGTWAWVSVDADGEAIDGDSGVIRSGWDGLSTISNNVTELLAAVRGMIALPDGWDGTIFTDSFVTLCRITTGKKFAGVPAHLESVARRQRARLKHKVVLLGGHPNRAELAAGQRKDGLPVSKWNVECDRKCGELAKGFFAKQEV